jgi:hypothetical protein
LEHARQWRQTHNRQLVALGWQLAPPLWEAIEEEQNANIFGEAD